MIAAGALIVASGSSDWFEMPSDSRILNRLIYFQLEQATESDGKIAVPTIYVTPSSYAQTVVTIDCAARTLDFPQTELLSRHTNESSGGVGGGRPTPVGDSRAYAAAATWVCDSRNSSGLAAFPRVSGDPKITAWRQLDAWLANLPSEFDSLLRRVAPSLTLTMNGQTVGVTSAQATACQILLELGDGRRARLDTLAASAMPRQRGLAFAGVTIRGFSDEDFRFIDYILPRLPYATC